MFEKGGRAPSRGILAGTREKSEPKLETKFDRLFEEVMFLSFIVYSSKRWYFLLKPGLLIVLLCRSVRQWSSSNFVKVAKPNQVWT